jgi:hypothetical protein
MIRFRSELDDLIDRFVTDIQLIIRHHVAQRVERALSDKGLAVRRAQRGRRDAAANSTADVAPPSRARGESGEASRTASDESRASAPQGQGPEQLKLF